jgi:hypothetical protein
VLSPVTITTTFDVTVTAIAGDLVTNSVELDYGNALYTDEAIFKVFRSKLFLPLVLKIP